MSFWTVDGLFCRTFHQIPANSSAETISRKLEQYLRTRRIASLVSPTSQNQPRRLFMKTQNFLQITTLLALILVATTSHAQSGGSTVRGTVRDPNGNLVSGASITLTNAAKNFTRTQTTNEDGAYVFTTMPP